MSISLKDLKLEDIPSSDGEPQRAPKTKVSSDKKSHHRHLKGQPARPNLTEMARHINLLHKDKAFAWQTWFKGERHPSGIPQVGYGEATDALIKKLARLNEGGAHVGIVPNVTDGRGRGGDNVTAIRWLLADFDSGTTTLKQLMKLAMKPHIVVRTSSGRRHVYYRVAGCTPDQFKAVQKALAKQLGSDPAVCDPSRCMRLAGTVNWKASPPCVATIEHPKKDGRRSHRVSVEKLLSAFEIDQAVLSVGAARPASAKADIGKLSRSDVKRLMERVDPDLRSNWLTVGQAIHSRWPDEKGFDLWTAWSKQSKKCKEEDQRQTWKSFKSDGGVTLGSIVRLAAPGASAPSAKEAGGPNGAVLNDACDLAELLAVAGKDKIGFDPKSHVWWKFTGVIWELSHGAQGALQFAQQLVMDTARRESDPSLKKKLGGITTLRSAVALAELDVRLELDAEMFDQNRELLAVANGVIELRTDFFRPATAADLLTRKAPVEHIEGVTCPLFEQFLREVCKEREDLIQYVIRLLGYLVTGHTREQQMYFLVGAAGNGKGTLLNLLAEILGRYVVPAPPALFARANSGNPNAASSAVMRLQGARIITCTEMLPGRIDEAFVKQISGQDKIAARELHGRQTEFLPEGKLLLSTNQDPHVSIAADAMWRRIVVIPFDVQFTERVADTKLAEKLRAESSGILNLIATAACSYLADGLLDSKTVKRASARLRLRSDSVAVWFAEYCKKGTGLKQQSLPAYDSYRRHVKAEGKVPLSQRVFNKSLADMGYAKEKNRKHNRFLGFELKPV